MWSAAESTVMTRWVGIPAPVRPAASWPRGADYVETPCVAVGCPNRSGAAPAMTGWPGSDPLLEYAGRLLDGAGPAEPWPATDQKSARTLGFQPRLDPAPAADDTALAVWLGPAVVPAWLDRLAAGAEPDGCGCVWRTDAEWAAMYGVPSPRGRIGEWDGWGRSVTERPTEPPAWTEPPPPTGPDRCFDCGEPGPEPLVCLGADGRLYLGRPPADAECVPPGRRAADRPAAPPRLLLPSAPRGWPPGAAAWPVGVRNLGLPAPCFPGRGVAGPGRIGPCWPTAFADDADPVLVAFMAARVSEEHDLARFRTAPGRRLSAEWLAAVAWDAARAEYAEAVAHEFGAHDRAVCFLGWTGDACQYSCTSVCSCVDWGDAEDVARWRAADAEWRARESGGAVHLTALAAADT